MLTVMCVLRSGGIYDIEWAYRLERAVRRHLSVPHRFFCLHDLSPGPCPPVQPKPMAHLLPGWWSKLHLFYPGTIKGPTLYLDLDTVIVGSLDPLADLPYDFAMMRNVHRPHMPGSAVMWFRERAPTEVWERFWPKAAEHIAYHEKHKDGPYLGDQAFIWDTLGREVDFIDDAAPGLIRSYKKHCRAGVPKGTSVVAFGGRFKPSTVRDPWVTEAWA